MCDTSEEHKYFSNVSFNVLDFLTNDVKANSLRKRSALANSNNITNSETESWGAVSCHSSVTLFKSVVLLDVVKVVTTNNDCVLHLI